MLVVGDEGAILIYMQGDKVLRRMFAASAQEGDVKSFRDLLAQDPDAPVRILVDIMDQSYLQQALPPVSSMSVNKLIKRRLERDFDPEDLKGALLIGRETSGRRDWNYLFIAVPNSPHLRQWIEFTQELPNLLSGIYLLPVETQFFMAQLAKAVTQESGKKSAEWQLLVSHHKVGGFRQIVFRNGKLIFTRMAQPIGDAMPDVIAGNIEQEIISTSEYLRRLSYNDDAGLDLYVMVSQDIKQYVDITSIKLNGNYVLTPYEAAQHLKLQQAALPGDHYGDVIMGACFGQQQKPYLKITTPKTLKLEQLYFTNLGVKYGAMAITALALLYSGYKGYEIANLSGDVSFQEANLKENQQSFQEIQDLTQTLPHNIDKITDVVGLYEKLSEVKNNPLLVVIDFIDVVGTIDNIRIKRFDWKASDLPKEDAATDFSALPTDGAAAPLQPNQFSATFDVEFLDQKGNLEKFIEEFGAFYKKLQNKFSNYEVSYSKLPGTFEGGESRIISIGEETPVAPGTTPTGEENFVVKVTITGPKADGTQETPN